MEPSAGEIEAGCQGTLRVEVTVPGTRAHSARSWLGDNAIHHAGELLARLAAYVPRQPVVEGITYHEGLNAVGIRGGVAGNVIPDECVVTVNYRFAPDRSGDEALAHVREVLDPYECVLTDLSEGARPGLDRLLVKDFVAAVGREPRAKYGWTDAARFSSLGVPALNWGPGDPNLAHTRDEYLDLPQLDECAAVLQGLAQPLSPARPLTVLASSARQLLDACLGEGRLAAGDLERAAVRWRSGCVGALSTLPSSTMASWFIGAVRVVTVGCQLAERHRVGLVQVDLDE